MKKLLPIATALLLLTGLVITSCTKSSSSTGNYTCTCSINTAGTINTVSLPFNSVSNATATSDCAQAQTTYTTAGSVATYTLK